MFSYDQLKVFFLLHFQGYIIHIRDLFGNFLDNPDIFLCKLMKIDINIEQNTTHNFTKLYLNKSSILFFFYSTQISRLSGYPAQTLIGD